MTRREFKQGVWFVAFISLITLIATYLILGPEEFIKPFIGE